MVNWTVGVADPGQPPKSDYKPPGNNNIRLIMPVGDSVNGSCLFDITTTAGRKIMSVCRMGFPCKAKVVLDNSEPADVLL